MPPYSCQWEHTESLSVLEVLAVLVLERSVLTVRLPKLRRLLVPVAAAVDRSTGLLLSMDATAAREAVERTKAKSAGPATPRATTVATAMLTTLAAGVAAAEMGSMLVAKVAMVVPDIQVLSRVVL